jgi:hypothetical protein
MVHWLYVAIVRPSISFASLVWWPGCQTTGTKKRLSKAHDWHAWGQGDADATEILTVLPPLDLVIKGGGEFGGTSPL